MLRCHIPIPRLLSSSHAAQQRCRSGDPITQANEADRQRKWLTQPDNPDNCRNAANLAVAATGLFRPCGGFLRLRAVDQILPHAL